MSVRAIKGLWAIMRPGNMLICATAVLCGGIIGGKPSERILTILSSPEYPEAMLLICAALSASLILAAGNVLNDIRDVACDTVNAPKRPLPSGIITQKTAAIFSVILALAGLLLSIPLGFSGFVIAIAAVIVLVLYDFKLKGVPLAGNIAVSFLGAFAFIYGGVAGGSISQSFIPAVFAFFFHLGREIIKDAADFDGDYAAGIKTSATVWGKSNACTIAGVVLILLTFTTAIPFATGIFGSGYMILAAAGIWPVALLSAWSVTKNQSRANLSLVSTVLKIDMPLGILTVLAGFQGF